MKHESEFDETLEMILLNPNLGNNELLGKLVNDGMNENIQHPADSLDVDSLQ